MTKKRTWTFALLAVALTVTLATSGLVLGKGKPEPPDPDPPPVMYALHRFSIPDDYLGGGRVTELNDDGELVGYYYDSMVDNGEQPFYFDITSGDTVATNLNDLHFEEGYGLSDVPGEDEWYIDAAMGINNRGDIAVALAKVGDSAILRGCVVELRPEDSSLPRLHLIPDEDIGTHKYARRINDDGVVLGGDPATGTAYIYRAPLHGQPGDITVQVIPEAIDVSRDNLNLLNPLMEGGATLVKAYIGNEIFTYDIDSGDLSYTDVSGLNIIRTFYNDFGVFCGTYTEYINKRRTRNVGYRFDDSFHALHDMVRAGDLNNAGDVIGRSSESRVILDHSVHGSISLDATIIAESVQEQAIWDDSQQFLLPMLSERDATGFPVVSGVMWHPDSTMDGYVLIPIP